MANDGISGVQQEEALKKNPGIGRSKGAYASGPEFENTEDDNTEGDEALRPTLHPRLVSGRFGDPPVSV